MATLTDAVNAKRREIHDLEFDLQLTEAADDITRLLEAIATAKVELAHLEATLDRHQ